MANTDAVNAVCSAIVHILSASMAEQINELGLTDLRPQFRVYQSSDFSSTDSDRTVTSGASVYLYRVLPNLSHRTPSGTLLPSGQRQHSKLPLDLHLLITIWGESASTQNRLLGWVMRTLEDYPMLPASVLNIDSDMPVFDDSEAVELLLSEISGEELLQVWDTLGSGGVTYQITIPYLVRNLVIESRRQLAVGEPVQTRISDMQRIAEVA